MILRLRTFLYLCSLFSCATTTKREQERVTKENRSKILSENWEQDQKKRMQHIKDQYLPKDPTPEDLMLTKEKSRIYYAGLVRSIISLDDGTSPADSIARATVSENIREMRAWKRTEMAHLARPSSWTARRVEQTIGSLPSRELLDEATSAILRFRKGGL